MGVDTYIFDERSKACFYFDRNYNFFCASDDDRARGIQTRAHDPDERLTAEEVAYACDANVAYWTDGGMTSGDDEARHRVWWNERIKQFAQERPEGSFFFVNDHQDPSSHAVLRAGGYEKVEYK
jgi:hypothetical protein